MTERQAIEALIERLEPELRDAFWRAMADLRGGINYSALISALERNDIEAAIAALDIEPAVFNRYIASQTSIFAQAGEIVASYIRIPGDIGVRFDMSNPRAERVIRETAAARVQGFTQEQIDTARRVIVEGYSAGEGPKTIATDLAGRINPITKRREGGVVGLSDPQSDYVRSMRRRLESGDPAELRKIIGAKGPDGKWKPGTGMTRRDRRYDRTITKAIETGEPIPQAKIDEMTARYSDRLLERRAEDVARTETAVAVETARKESYRQALDKHGLPDDAVEKTWRHSGLTENARMQHVLMNRHTVQGIETPFEMPDGTLMQHSHDPAGGAKHNANCACDTEFSISFGTGVE